MKFLELIAALVLPFVVFGSIGFAIHYASKRLRHWAFNRLMFWSALLGAYFYEFGARFLHDVSSRSREGAVGDGLMLIIGLWAWYALAQSAHEERSPPPPKAPWEAE